MLRLPLEAELSAAIIAAAKAGLGEVTPELLHLGNHTSVRLKPWPIVGRIASGTSFDFSPASLVRELEIGAYLATRSAPSVRPITELSAGPYFDQACAITLWKFVNGHPVSSEYDELLAAEALKQVHSALWGLDTELPSFITKVESCATILADAFEAPKLEPTERRFLMKVYETLRDELSDVDEGGQPLHGDTHLGNVLVTGSGAIWMDLEAACLGPAEWDIVNLPEASWSTFGSINTDLIALFAEVRSLCVAVWCWAEFDRSAAAGNAAIEHLGRLRKRFG